MWAITVHCDKILNLFLGYGKTRYGYLVLSSGVNDFTEKVNPALEMEVQKDLCVCIGRGVKQHVELMEQKKAFYHRLCVKIQGGLG